MSTATITEITKNKMTPEEKRNLVLANLSRLNSTVTINDIKDKIDGHAGRTALLFTSMTRSGLLKKTDKTREGKAIYVKGDGKPSATKKVTKKAKPVKKPKIKANTTKKGVKKASKPKDKKPVGNQGRLNAFERRAKKDHAATPIFRALPTMPVSAGNGGQPREVIASNLPGGLGKDYESGKSVEKARASGLAVGSNLMEAKRQIDAFLDGLRESLGA